MLEAERPSQYDRALFEVRDMILSGQLEAGDRLAETVLADQLGVSRTPLRQALARLIEEGLVERQDNGRARVVSYTFDDIVDAIEIRGAIEGTAARLAAERGPTPQEIEEVTEILDAIDQAIFAEGGIEFFGYVDGNARFHVLLARMSHSRIVEREIERVNRLPLASPSSFLKGQEMVPNFRESLRLAQQQHRSLFEAIAGGEGSRAEALAREHARLARTNLKYMMKAKPSDARRVPGLALVSN